MLFGHETGTVQRAQTIIRTQVQRSGNVNQGGCGRFFNGSSSFLLCSYSAIQPLVLCYAHVQPFNHFAVPASMNVIITRAKPRLPGPGCFFILICIHLSYSWPRPATRQPNQGHIPLPLEFPDRRDLFCSSSFSLQLSVGISGCDINCLASASWNSRPASRSACLRVTGR